VETLRELAGSSRAAAACMIDEGGGEIMIAVKSRILGALSGTEGKGNDIDVLSFAFVWSVCWKFWGCRGSHVCLQGKRGVFY
jgi:hypothetical protein